MECVGFVQRVGRTACRAGGIGGRWHRLTPGGEAYPCRARHRPPTTRVRSPSGWDWCRCGTTERSVHGWRRFVAGDPDEVARYRGGETKLLGFFVGQVMKRSGGQGRSEGLQRCCGSGSGRRRDGHRRARRGACGIPRAVSTGARHPGGVSSMAPEAHKCPAGGRRDERLSPPSQRQYPLGLSRQRRDGSLLLDAPARSWRTSSAANPTEIVVRRQHDLAHVPPGVEPWDAVAARATRS